MVKAAFVVWQGLIAPLFDTSRMACIVEVLPERAAAERIEYFQETSPAAKVLRLVEWEVTTLVCGAISRHVQAIAVANGIQVISYVAGDAQAVMRAWLEERIDDAEFKMPGCGKPGIKKV